MAAARLLRQTGANEPDIPLGNSLPEGANLGGREQD